MKGATQAEIEKRKKPPLSPATVESYVGLAKLIVASVVDENGLEVFPRKWNNRFIDLPVIKKSQQKTPEFTGEIVSGLAAYEFDRERVLFIVLAGSGLRIGEALGIEIKHLSHDFGTISIEQKVYLGVVEGRLKTESSARKVDLHPDIGAVVRAFVGSRTTGLLFSTPDGMPLNPSNIANTHLYPALRRLGYRSESGDDKAGFHAFRRFRETHLGKVSSCSGRLRDYWMGHAIETMGDRYNKIHRDDDYRIKWAKKCKYGFRLPSSVQDVPKLPDVAS